MIHRGFHDWELEFVNSFLDLLHSNIPRREGCERMYGNLKGVASLLFALVVKLSEGYVILSLEECLVC